MARHPWHPLIAHFPLAAWVLATLLDLLHVLGLDRLMGVAGIAGTSSLLLWIGLAASLPAMVLGLLDYAALPRGVQESRPLMLHIAWMGSASSLFLGAALWRLRAGSVTWPIEATQIGGSLCLVCGGYCASVVVFRLMPSARAAIDQSGEGGSPRGRRC